MNPYHFNIYLIIMSLNDIWRNVSSEIGFFTKETFDDVPVYPGIYAWFFPLRITTQDVDEFLRQVSTIFNYDSQVEGKPLANTNFQLGWNQLSQTLTVENMETNLAELKKVWELYSRDKEEFDELRNVIMRSSIFIPPLYVGKSNNLRRRCFEHINGTKKGKNFHQRYQDYALQNKIPACKVSDLLFVCIKTFKTKLKLEDLIEKIMLSLSKPAYSKK
jgi:hypothetical protein